MTNMWENLEEQLAETFKKRNSFTLITPKKTPHFYAGVEKLAEKFNLGFVPAIVVADEITGTEPLWIRKIPNATAHPMNPAHLVVINDGMMKLTGAKIGKSMSPALETVMAHEFSHLKDGVLLTDLQFGLPYKLPLVAVAGLALYDLAKARTQHKLDQSKKEYGAQLTNNIHAVADEEIKKAQDAPANKWGLDPAWQKSVIQASRYLLVAAAGLATGLGVASGMSFAAEFRADKRAVEITKHPEIFKKALTDLGEAFSKAYKNKSADDIMGKSIKQKFHSLISEFTQAHPSNSERFAHIDHVAASISR